MKKRILALFMAVALVLASVTGRGDLTPAVSAAGGMTLEEAKAIYLNADAAVEDRVSALLGQMTLAEKIGQMVQPETNNGGATVSDITNYGIGTVLSGGGAAPSAGNSADDWKTKVEQYEAAALQTRLGIPLIYSVDAVHGHNNVDGATIFPHNIGLGATGNTALVQQIGAAAAEEVKATGIQWTFAPTIGIVHNERWGRFYECFGETADIVSEMGDAYIKGFQGETGSADHLGSSRIIATAKHYIAEGLTTDGVNQGNAVMSQEDYLNIINSDMMEPYRSAIESGVRSVMVSYNSINGVKCHGNQYLITDILKDQLGFDGIVVSDYNGIDQIAADSYTEQVAISVNAGIDVFMEPYDWKDFIRTLTGLVEDGAVSMERIDDAVTRILRVKFELGLFEEAYSDDRLMDTFGSSVHRMIARQAVRESLTLLKNDTLSDGRTVMEALAEYDNILIAGSSADDIGRQCGGWTISWQGSAGNITQGTTVLQGFYRAVGNSKTITYSETGTVTAGQQAAIVVIGEEPYAESNGDRNASGLVLSSEDKAVLSNIRSQAPDMPVIVVLITGRPLTIADQIENMDALVCAWLPGTEGDGIADVLFGNYEFTGTTTVTWPWYAQDITEKETDSSKVLFPLGTGLKKDGTSIKEGGQTVIPAVPEAPSTTVNLGKTGYVLEAERLLDDSYRVVTNTESAVTGEAVTFVGEWTGEWANAKWNVYVPEAGTYNLVFRAAVNEDCDNLYLYYQTPTIENDGNANKTAVSMKKTGSWYDYQDFTLYNVTLSKGNYQFKLMTDAGGGGGFNLDKITFVNQKDAAGSMVIEAEDCTDESYQINLAETYVEFTTAQYSNAKWAVKVPATGEYKVIFTYAAQTVPDGVTFYYHKGQGSSYDDGDANPANISFPATGGADVYNDYLLNGVNLEQGDYEFKLMSTKNPGTVYRLDKVTLVPVKVQNPEGSEAPDESQNTVIAKGAVDVYYTSTEKSGDKTWYKAPAAMENQLERQNSLNLTAVDENSGSLSVMCIMCRAAFRPQTAAVFQTA